MATRADAAEKRVKIDPENRPTPEPTQAEYREMEEDAVAKIMKQKKVRVRLYQVPKDSSDQPWPDVPVAINGYVWVIQRGETVEIPQSVADILEEAGHI
jgi:hypothetical protein